VDGNSQDEDLFVWEKYSETRSDAGRPHFGPIAQWRDPFLFQKDGTTYMVAVGLRAQAERKYSFPVPLNPT
jgi:hypothetical protein